MYDGDVLIYDGHPFSAHVPDLHSNYRTRWYGPFLGLDMGYDFACNLQIYGNVEYHWIAYRGRGHWNLRSEFYNDFQHKAYGHGVSGEIGATYPIVDCLLVGVNLTYFDYIAKHGRDRTFIKEDVLDSESAFLGTAYYVTETRMNKAHWRSFRAEASLTYQF